MIEVCVKTEILFLTPITVTYIIIIAKLLELYLPKSVHILWNSLYTSPIHCLQWGYFEFWGTLGLVNTLLWKLSTVLFMTI